MSDPAQRLCDRARAGDREAVSELLALHYERIYACLRRLCGQEAEAADLTQRTFGKAWAALGSFDGRSGFSTWLHGIAHHLYVDWRRRQRPAESRSDEWWAGCAADTPSPFEDAAARDLAQHLYRLVEQLDEEARETVHLHYYQGLSLAETAAALGIAASTVKYRLRQALDFLRARATELNPNRAELPSPHKP